MSSDNNTSTTTTTTDSNNVDEGNNKSSIDGPLVVLDILIPNNKSNNDSTNKTSMKFYYSKHLQYLFTLGKKLDSKSSYEGAVTEHLRMSGIYWTMGSLSMLLQTDSKEWKAFVNGNGTITILDWVMSCFVTQQITTKAGNNLTLGCFGGNVGHYGHVLYTLSALQIIAMITNGKIDSVLSETQQEQIIQFCISLQLNDGSFVGSCLESDSGEVDTRFSYCAISSLALLGALDRITHKQAATDYILSCQNFDGGFGSIPGAESHAGQVFTCIGALSILQTLDQLSTSIHKLLWWTSERQCDSGGLNGRPEKQADVCYSWWIVSVLSICGGLDYINTSKLAKFICQAQDDVDGGIADRPQDMPDVFHTFFGLCGLSLLQYNLQPTTTTTTAQANSITIDPVYALPTHVVQAMKLPGQVLAPPVGELDSRLDKYQVLQQEKL